MRKFILLLVAFYLVRTMAWCACPGKDCKTLLLSAVGKMKSSSANSYRLQYALATNYETEEGHATHAIEAKIVMNGDKSAFTSDEVEMYKDDQHSITINKRDRMIYITKSSERDWSKIRLQAFSMVYDSLLNRAESIDCKPSGITGQDKFEVILPKAYQSMTGVSRMTYWIDSHHMEIKKCSISYVKHAQGIQSIDFTIKAFDSVYKGTVFQGTALSLVIGSDNKTLSKYKTYTMNDLR